MSNPDVQRVKQALIDAGVEIYRTNEIEIQIAERIRLHIMDSGVRVRIDGTPHVTFTARSQRSDFPNSDPKDLFDKVRHKIGAEAGGRGYLEKDATTVEVKDPVDKTKILDVWHEVTYQKEVADASSVVDEVRWALDIDKYVAG